MSYLVAQPYALATSRKLIGLGFVNELDVFGSATASAAALSHSLVGVGVLAHTHCARRSPHVLVCVRAVCVPSIRSMRGACCRSTGPGNMNENRLLRRRPVPHMQCLRFVPVSPIQAHHTHTLTQLSCVSPAHNRSIERNQNAECSCILNGPRGKGIES